MIVDFRCRPPFDETIHHLFSKQLMDSYEIYHDYKTDPSQRSLSMEDFFAEMNEAGISKGVVTGRRTVGGLKEIKGQENRQNDAVKRLLETYPDRFIGAFGIDPTDGEQVLEYIQEYVIEGPFTSVLMEPGICKIPMSLDNERLLPIYDYLEAHHIPMMLAMGELNYRAMRHMRPEALDNVLEMFNDLTTIIYHGGWPYVNEVMWIAFNRPNLYISPDYTMLYTWPGYESYITAANYILTDRIIFGSGYPYWSMIKAKEYYLSKLRPEVVDKVMGINALRALNLPVPDDAPVVNPFFKRESIPKEISDLNLHKIYEKRKWD